MYYYEQKSRSIPLPAFTETRDVVSHLYDLAENINRPSDVEKNIVEIKQHFRRGIIETYCELYDSQMANIYRSYERYKSRLKIFEKLLYLYKKHVDVHNKISASIKSAQELWVDGRTLKNNDLESQKFKKAIKDFKRAYEMIESLDEDVDILWNNFYQRFYIGISVVIIALIALAIFVF
jgi:tetratricopeptide (TPR) repeat protein